MPNYVFPQDDWDTFLRNIRSKAEAFENLGMPLKPSNPEEGPVLNAEEGSVEETPRHPNTPHPLVKRLSGFALVAFLAASAGYILHKNPDFLPQIQQIWQNQGQERQG